jgi:hypothetical protein
VLKTVLRVLPPLRAVPRSLKTTVNERPKKGSLVADGCMDIQYASPS